MSERESLATQWVVTWQPPGRDAPQVVRTFFSSSEVQGYLATIKRPAQVTAHCVPLAAEAESQS